MTEAVHRLEASRRYPVRYWTPTAVVGFTAKACSRARQYDLDMADVAERLHGLDQNPTLRFRPQRVHRFHAPTYTILAKRRDGWCVITMWPKEPEETP